MHAHVTSFSRMPEGSYRAELEANDEAVVVLVWPPDEEVGIMAPAPFASIAVARDGVAHAVPPEQLRELWPLLIAAFYEYEAAHG